MPISRNNEIPPPVVEPDELSDDSSAATNRARQGVTGHNVRYVLLLGLAGVIIAFIIVYAFFN
jgi:hypothetical protein